MLKNVHESRLAELISHKSAVLERIIDYNGQPHQAFESALIDTVRLTSQYTGLARDIYSAGCKPWSQK
jgi:hypothetical protein